VVAGTALSPEFIFAGLWGMPDTRGYGIFWLDRDTLEAAYDMKGAFNRSRSGWRRGLRAGGDRRRLALLSPLRRPPGARPHDQPSHAMLDSEIKGQRVPRHGAAGDLPRPSPRFSSTSSSRAWWRRSASRSRR
jgi:putative ABC transport system permease protein